MSEIDLPRVDGDALGGVLGDLFAADLTMATTTCAGCGRWPRWPRSTCI